MEKIIHQIWIGEYNLPEREKKWTNIIKDNHKDFEYLFTDNYNIPELSEELLEVKEFHQSRKNWVHIADMLRYVLVEKYGGLYIDCDYEMINPIHDLELEKYDGFLPLHFNVGETICNSIFGFKKNHSLMKYVVEQIPTNKHWLGPNFFGRCVKNYLGLDEHEIDIVNVKKLEEINIKVIHSREELKKNYLSHHLAYTWHPENQEKLEKNINFKKL